nr:hypothetical protein B0A51_03443 [Rachicladosporium sp. CCFEE 5018]
MKTLLLAQRVGKNWHSGINESSKLRKMLFFDRDPDCIDAIRCWAYDMPETGNHCSKCNNNYQYLNLLIAWTGRGQQDWKTYKPVQVTLDVLALPSYVSAMKMSWLAPRYTADEPAMLIEPDGMF